jgi:hypothetical protein
LSAFGTDEVDIPLARAVIYAQCAAAAAGLAQQRREDGVELFFQIQHFVTFGHRASSFRDFIRRYGKV